MKNLNFETQIAPKQAAQDALRIEKFFIEADSFSSKTIAYLQLKEPQREKVVSYNFSRACQKVAVYTTSGSLYVFGDWEIAAKAEPVIEAAPDVPTYEESKGTLHTKEFQFKESLPDDIS